jgi:hypothetical protein
MNQISSLQSIKSSSSSGSRTPSARVPVGPNLKKRWQLLGCLAGCKQGRSAYRSFVFLRRLLEAGVDVGLLIFHIESFKGGHGA